MGNRTAKNSTSYTYDNADQLTAVGSTSYGYDSNGNQNARGSDTFSWDFENRLTSETIGGTTTTESYNGDGLRQTRASGGNTTSYIWDVAAKVPMLLQDGTNTYVYGLGLISTTDGSGNQTYYLKDGLGNTVALCNGSGTVTATYTYDVFGAVKTHTGGTTEFNFTGEQNDPNGLEYLRARYYDNATGRFLGLDPAGQGYAYAGGNPANMVDPTGKYAICGVNSDWGYVCFDSTEVGLGLCDANGACYLYSGDGSAPGNNVYAKNCEMSTNICALPNGDLYVAFRSEADGSFSYLGNINQITGSALQKATTASIESAIAVGNIAGCQSARDAVVRAGVGQFIDNMNSIKQKGDPTPTAGEQIGRTVEIVQDANAVKDAANAESEICGRLK